MNDTSTADRILDAAETLFADRGFRATSLRAITTAADVNVAAVNYHFGSKEALIQAIFQRKAGPINARRLELLDQLEASADPDRLEAILDAFYRPAVSQLMKHPVTTRSAFMLMARMHAERSSELQATFKELFSEVAKRFGAAVHRCLPHLPPEELGWRFHFLIGIMVHAMAEFGNAPGTAGCEFPLPGTPSQPPSVDTFTNRLVSFAAAGLRAPAPLEKLP